jgi:hypothetical protein
MKSKTFRMAKWKRKKKKKKKKRNRRRRRRRKKKMKMVIWGIPCICDIDDKTVSPVPASK